MSASENFYTYRSVYIFRARPIFQRERRTRLIFSVCSPYIREEKEGLDSTSVFMQLHVTCWKEKRVLGGERIEMIVDVLRKCTLYAQ